MTLCVQIPPDLTVFGHPGGLCREHNAHQYLLEDELCWLCAWSKEDSQKAWQHFTKLDSVLTTLQGPDLPE